MSTFSLRNIDRAGGRALTPALPRRVPAGADQGAQLAPPFDRVGRPAHMLEGVPVALRRAAAQWPSDK